MKAHFKIQNLAGKNLMKKGFAIIATLMIMTLLTVLAFAMMSLSSTSSRSVTILSGMQRAKANARMALMLAIGERQEQDGARLWNNLSVSMVNNMKTCPYGG